MESPIRLSTSATEDINTIGARTTDKIPTSIPNFQPKGFLDLPAELREAIYTLAVVKPTNTITMLFDHNSYANEVSASQPALALVNRQIRSECLATFYSSNTFTAQLDNATDLATAKRWVRAIGDTNVADLRTVVMCGWTRLPYGHMSRRVWVKVVVDLHERKMLFEGDAPLFQVFGQRQQRFEEVFAELCEMRKGVRFDARCLRGLMEGVQVMCVSY